MAGTLFVKFHMNSASTDFFWILLCKFICKARFPAKRLFREMLWAQRVREPLQNVAKQIQVFLATIVGTGRQTKPCELSNGGRELPVYCGLDEMVIALPGFLFKGWRGIFQRGPEERCPIWTC